MKILLSGAAGFIGYHLSKELIKNNNEVVGIDNLNNYYDKKHKIKRLQNLKSDNFIFIENDINKIKSQNLQGIDLIINLAAQPGVRLPPQKYSEYYLNNINGFNEVLLYALNNNVKNVIYASSSSVYSDLNKMPFSEKDKIYSQKSTYGFSKYVNELQAEFYFKKFGINSIGLRFFTVYGEFGRPDMAYYNFAKNILLGKEIILHNDGLMTRDMTYIEDIIKGIMNSIDKIQTNNQEICKVFNLGKGDPVKTKDLLMMTEKLLNKKARVNYINTDNEVMHTLSCNKIAGKYLDFKPKTTLNDGLENFINWFLKNSNG